MRSDVFLLRSTRYIDSKIPALRFTLPVLRKVYKMFFLKRRKGKLRRMNRKNMIRVMLVCSDINTFALEGIYELLCNDSRYEVVIGIIVYDHGDPKVGTIREYQCIANKYLNCKGYNTILIEEGKEKVIISNWKPDVVIYCTSPSLFSVGRMCEATVKALNCSIPYGYYLTNLQQAQFNNLFVNQMDYKFEESNTSVMMAKRYSVTKGINSYYLGYPKLDNIISGKGNNHPWKRNSAKAKKRIIWAPHHSIENDPVHYGFSSFLVLSEYMFELASKYVDDIEIAFRPHPILKTKLYAHYEWGKEKTENYYQKWEKIDNGQLYEEGDYTGLFLDSDAIILDSISFILEYAVTGKPILFTVRDESINNKFNELGKEAYKNVPYKVSVDYPEKIEDFIKDVLIDGNDYLFEKRTRFVKSELYPPKEKTASLEIAKFLEKEIRGAR